jgi:tetratricopeptide (TPR) repeat protein
MGRGMRREGDPGTVLILAARRICIVGLPALLALAIGAVQPAAAQHKMAKPAAAQGVPLFDGLGAVEHPVTTRSPKAQQYFNQGLRLMYAFNHNEAIRAFNEAGRLDPECAMAQWGVALALGPNYNLQIDPERAKTAYETVQQALKLAITASPHDRAYIEALATRYSSDPEADRKPLDRAYADAMRKVSQQYPDDLDAATLFAESMMDLRPWDLWAADGGPNPGTEELIAALESVIQRCPEHTGANHLYIHAVEASLTPQRGLPSAQRLGGLAPGAGHLVHMPAHIYLRLGMYQNAVDCNRHAAGVDREYIAKNKPQGIYPMMYYPHNVHFLWSALCFEGRSGEALKAGEEFTALVPAEMVRKMPMIEGFVPTHLFTLVRFGKWDAILKQPQPPEDLTYAVGIWHYARGRALAGFGKLDAAAGELDSLAKSIAAMPPDRLLMRHRADHLLSVAYYLLAGDLAERQKRTDTAIVHLREAVRLQDALRYDEPPAWFYPTRQSLGAVLLKAGKPKDAELLYQEDLKKYPENGWSLFGLVQSLQAQGRNADAEAAEARFKKAWARSDVKLEASAY